jgi:organic hydroperoxide reductase OsmC/OhrA
VPKLHTYDAVVTWTGDRGTGTSHYAAYDRTHEITAAGQPAIAGSSDAAFRGDPARWNPEQLLVVSLAQCHMLWYLHLAAVAGVVVTGYVDRAVGTMAEQADGGGQFVEVVLHPTVTVSDAAMAERAMELHDRAHELCFIARSVNFPVRHEASIGAAADPTGGDTGPANGWRAAAAAAVRTAYERYLDAFTHADLAAIDAVVAYPLAHISQGDVRLCGTFPIDPAELRRTSGWHTTVNARYDVVAVSPEKAHLILHRGDRVRADGSLIETVAAFYAFTRTDQGWKIFAISDLVDATTASRRARADVSTRGDMP